MEKLDEILADVRTAVENAERKHPFFCAKLFPNRTVAECERIERHFKDACERCGEKVTAEDLLEEEIAEAGTADAKNNASDVYAELMDCAAVIIRMAERAKPFALSAEAQAYIKGEGGANEG